MYLDRRASSTQSTLYSPKGPETSQMLYLSTICADHLTQSSQFPSGLTGALSAYEPMFPQALAAAS